MDDYLVGKCVAGWMLEGFKGLRGWNNLVERATELTSEENVAKIKRDFSKGLDEQKKCGLMSRERRTGLGLKSKMLSYSRQQKMKLKKIEVGLTKSS